MKRGNVSPSKNSVYKSHRKVQSVVQSVDTLQERIGYIVSSLEKGLRWLVGMMLASHTYG